MTRSAEIGGAAQRQESSPDDVQRYFLSGGGLRGVQARPHQHASAEGASTSVREFQYCDEHDGRW
jgi:hypothetical protein